MELLVWIVILLLIAFDMLVCIGFKKLSRAIRNIVSALKILKEEVYNERNK